MLYHLNAEAAQEFDFADHRVRAVEEYRKIRPLYEGFSHTVDAILREALRTREIKVASIESRAKDLESFGNKAVTPLEEDPSQPKYLDPIVEVTDLAAARVITFFPQTVGEVEAAVEAEFAIIEKVDKMALLVQEERLGYQSVHFVVGLKANRLVLPEYSRFANLRAEIQVRTILQHAWAEIEHDIQYKSVETIPTPIRRRFMALAGLLEIADREFQAIQNDDERLVKEARTYLLQGQLQDVEITPDALRAYLDSKLGPDRRMSDVSYEWTARLLRRLGFKNFQEVDDCISQYDDDKVGRTVYYGRMGQVARFESQILAGLGREFIVRHFWADDKEWALRAQAQLTRLEQAGITVGTYLLGDISATPTKQGEVAHD